MVASGKVATKSPAGEAWDALGRAPDPFVCLTIGTSRTCTSTVKDSFQPVWNEQFPAATATALRSGVIVVISDEDIASNDPIGLTTVVPVREQNFLLGRWVPSCGDGEFPVTYTAQ